MDYQIHGTLYHLHGPLQPEPGEGPQYAQLFFHDPQAASAFRNARSPDLDQPFLLLFTEFLHEHNHFVANYLTAHERFRRSAGPLRIALNPRMELVIQEGADRRRENLPVADDSGRSCYSNS